MKKKFLIIFLIIFFGVLFFAKNSQAATYHYVYPGLSTGNNDGSSWANAWKDVDNIVWATLSAEAATQPVYLYFKKGSVIASDSMVITAGGSSEINRIILTTDPADSGANPLWTGESIWTTGWTPVSGTIYSRASPTRWGKIWYKGVELTAVTGMTPGVNQYSWELDIQYINIGKNPNGETITYTGWNNSMITASDNVNYITVQNMKFYRSNGGAFSNYQTSGTHHQDYWTWEDNTIQDISGNGFYVGGWPYAACDNWIIRRNTFNNVGGWPATTGRHGTYIENSDNWLVEYNTFLNCTAGFGIMWRDDSDNWIVRYNYTYNSGNVGALNGDRGGGISAGAEDGSSTGAQIYNNISVGDNFGIYLGGNNLIGPTGVSIYNNTVYNSTRYGLLLNGTAAQIASLKNNIFWCPSVTNKIISANGLDFDASDYNLIGPENTGFIRYADGYYDTLAVYVAASGLDTHSLKSDPFFVSIVTPDFHLQQNSSAINTGINVGLTRDFDGITVPQGSAPDIGAYEYVGVPPPDTTPPAAPSGVTVN